MKLIQFIKENIRKIIIVSFWLIIIVIIGFLILTKVPPVPKEKPMNFDKISLGQMIIYNEYSTTTQILIYNSRIQSGTSSIYRIKNMVKVPGFTILNGEKIPGSATIDIYSDNPNDFFEVADLARVFKILGLKGDDRYDTIYGKLVEIYFICPEDLPTPEARVANLKIYSNDFMINNPGSTVGDFFDTRYADLQKHHCQKTLNYMASSSEQGI